MKKENEFKNYLHNLNVEEYYRQRSEIIDKCKITPQIFRNWKNGYSQVYELAKPIINEIAKSEIFKI